MTPPDEPWPLRRLVLRTPRLQLRPDDDAGLDELIEQSHGGDGEWEDTPFRVDWLPDAPQAELDRYALQYYWSLRASLTAVNWSVNFLARLDGAVIGNILLTAEGFTSEREVRVVTWLGHRHRGRGHGTHLRAAALAFAFDHLGARVARSTVFHDNAASLASNRRLGYVEYGSELYPRQGRPARQVLLRLTRDRFDAHRPDWPLVVDGLTGDCLAMLGAT